MSSNFNRFLHLERSRAEKPKDDSQVRLRDGDRFASVAGPGAETPQAVSVPEAHVERFKRHGETPLVLDEKPAPGQRFPYCARCESANGRFATHCMRCGADLGTPEQLDYNERYWRAREQAEAQSHAEHEAHVKARQRADAEHLEEQRRYREQMAEQLMQQFAQEHRKASLFSPCLGLGLLRLIPHRGARWGTLAGVAGLAFLLSRFGSGSLRTFGSFLGIVLFLSFIPTDLWRARGRRW